MCLGERVALACRLTVEFNTQKNQLTSAYLVSRLSVLNMERLIPMPDGDP